MSVKQAKQMAEKAYGSFGANDLTQKNSTSKPLIEYLGEDEQLQYLLSHSSKGFRIFETDGEERTPDHDSRTWGGRFLLISDQRIFYVVGAKSEDKINEFNYANVNSTDSDCSLTHCRLNFTLANGREYKFATHNSDAEDAEEYIEQCINRRYQELKSQVSKVPDVDIEVPEPTSFDKLWERKNRYDTIEENTSLWQSSITRQKQLQERATAFATVDINIPDPESFDSAQAYADALQITEDVIGKCGKVVRMMNFIENLSEEASKSEISEAEEVADKCKSKLTSIAQSYDGLIDTSSIEELQQSVEDSLEELEQSNQINQLRNSIDEAQQALAQHELDVATQRIENVKASLQESSTIGADLRHELDEEISEIESKIADFQELQETEQIAGDKLDEAQTKLEEGEYDSAASIAQDGIGTCQEAIDHEFSTGDDIIRSIREIQSELERLQSKAQDISKLIKTAEQRLQFATAAVESDSYDTAQKAVGELEGLTNELEEHECSEAEKFRENIDSIAKEIERGRETIRVEDLLSSVDAKISRGNDLLSHGSLDKANQAFKSASESLKKASKVVRANELHRPEEIEEKGTELEEIRELVTRTISLLNKIEDDINSGSYKSADSALSELREIVEEISANELITESLDGIHQRIDDFQTDVDDLLSDKQWEELLTEVNSLSNTAEELIVQSEFIEAEKQLISALETIDEAARVNNQSSLENQDILFEKQLQIQSLLEKVESQAKQEHSTLITEAEALVAKGIEDRKADNPAGATEAFTEAKKQYAKAMQLADEQNMPELWETKERHAMVTEYLEVTTEDLQERQRETQQEMTTALEKAESAVVQAEQYAEVDDTVSVRDSLSNVVEHLDTATQLLNVTGVTDELQSKYDSLIERADAVRKSLPNTENEKSYRNQDLVESLQILTTKLGESPRQEFVNKYGEYPSEAYLDEFGSWSESLAAANLQQIDESSRGQRTYRRIELLDELTTVAEKIDQPPTKSQVNELGQIAATTIENRFKDWETALELAGITESTESTEQKTTHDTGGQKNQRRHEDTEQANILNLIQQEVQEVD